MGEGTSHHYVYLNSKTKLAKLAMGIEHRTASQAWGEGAVFPSEE